MTDKKLLSEMKDVFGISLKSKPEKAIKKASTKREKLIDDIKALEGMPPHDVGYNIVRGDGYFAKDIERRLSRTRWTYEDLRKRAVEEARQCKPSWDR